MLVPQPSPRQNGGLKIIIVASLNSGKKNALRAGGSGESEKKKNEFFDFFFQKRHHSSPILHQKTNQVWDTPNVSRWIIQKKLKKKKKKNAALGITQKKKRFELCLVRCVYVYSSVLMLKKR